MTSVANLQTQNNAANLQDQLIHLEAQKRIDSNELPANLKQDLYNVQQDIENLLKNPGDANNLDIKEALLGHLNSLTSDYQDYYNSNPNNMQLNRVMDNLATVNFIYSDNGSYKVNNSITSQDDFLPNKINEDKDVFNHEVLPSIQEVMGE